MNKSKKLSKIKKNHYNFQREDAIKQFGLDLKFKNQPYTYLRWRFNMEISTYLIYLFLRTSLSANFISLIYIILSPLGFFLVISGSKTIVVLGLVIFFFKSLFDYVDGYIARYRGQTTMKGHALDVYGAFVGDIFFKTSIGLFIFNKYDDVFHLKLTIIYLICNVLLINKFYKSIFYDLTSKRIFKKTKYKNIKNFKKNSIFYFFKKLFIILESIFDDRARSLDFLILLFLLNIFYDLNLILYAFTFIVFKNIVKMLGTFIVFFLKF